MTESQFFSFTCPCGHPLAATSEDGFVNSVNAHLAEAHPGMSYTREQILSISADR